MEVSNPRSRIGGSRTGQLIASRRGALIVAVAAALAAGLLFYLVVQHYRTNSPVAAAPTSAYVFVAGKYIPQGTPAQTLAAEGLMRRVQLPAGQIVAGAITDPSVIAGEVSTASIANGQQITVADFTHTTISVSSYLSGVQRAISLPFDASHGITAFLQQGQTVDVMETLGGVTKVVAQNITVLSNATGDVVLRVSDKQALKMANAADDAKLWLTLRPPVAAQQSVQVGATSNG